MDSAIRNGLAEGLSKLPKGVNERLMTNTNNKYTHLISVYTSTLPTSNKENEVFCQKPKTLSEEYSKER